MVCQRCGSERVLETSAKGSDCQTYSLGRWATQGYAPNIDGICDDDYLFPDICLDCGQCQGVFPKQFVPPEEDID